MANTNKDLQEAKQLLLDLNRLRSQLNKQPLKLADEELLKQLKSLPRDIEATRKELDNASFSASGLYNTLREITSEFKGQKNEVIKVRGAFRQLEDAAQKLKLDEQGIVDLTRNQLEAIQEKLVKNEAIVDQEARRLISSAAIGKELEEEVKNWRDMGASVDDINDLVSDMLRSTKDLSEEQKASIQYYYDQHKTVGQIVKAVEKRLEVEKKISELMGVTGAVVGGLGALMERLGMRSGIFHDAMRDSADEMREMAKDTANGVAKFSQLQIAAKGFSTVAKGFGKALLDPAAIIGKIAQGFFDVNKASVELTRLTGETASGVANVNMNLISSVDFLETAAELTKQIGMSATNIFSSKTLAAVAEAKNLLGLTAKEAGNLARFSDLSGVAVEDYNENIYGTVNAYNSANRSGVAHGIVLQDVLNASDDVSVSLGGQPGKIAAAAAAARGLGLDLAKVNQIADGMLDFESSISAEMEAQLLTGKSMNLAKAREYALTNDLEGLSNELKKNGASAVEFANMGRVAQSALAKSLGMSREELAKTVLTQEEMNGMTEDQIAKARGVTLEQSKAMDVQAKMEKSIAKLTEAFAPMLDILIPIVEILSKMVRLIAAPISWVLKLASIFSDRLTPAIEDTDNWFTKLWKNFAAALAAIPKLIAGIGILGLASALKNLLSGKSFTTGIFTKIKEAFTGMGKAGGGILDTLKEKVAKIFTKPKGGGPIEDLEEKIKEKAGDKVEDLVEGSNEIKPEVPQPAEPKSSGQKIKEFLTNLAAGLKEMASIEVTKGALNLIPASIGLIAFIPGYFGARLIQSLDGEKLQAGLTALATGLKEMGTGKVFLGSLALVTASIGLIAFMPGYLGARLLQSLDGEKLKTSLEGLANGLKEMGTGKVFLGSLALVTASIGLIAFMPGYFGAKLVEKLDGEKLKAGLEGLGTGLSAMGTGKVFLGSLALVTASIGLIAFMPGYFGAKLVEKLDGEKLKAGLGGLATGVSAMGTGRVLLGSVALITAGAGLLLLTLGAPGMMVASSLGASAGIGLSALSVGLSTMSGTLLGGAALIVAGAGFVAMTLGALGMGAVALLGAPAGAGLSALAVGLIAFGTAAMNPLTWAGIGLLAAFGTALIPLGYALSLVAPTVGAFGTVVEKALGGLAGIITAVATGFVTMLNSVTLEKVANMALLGPALASAAIGLGVMSAALAGGSIATGLASFLTGGGIMADLERLSLMAEPLSSVGISLTAIATGLVMLSSALATIETGKLDEIKELVMTTAIAAPMVAATGAITELINGISGGSEKDNNSQLVAKLDELISIVKAGGDVIMDGNKVGHTISLNSYKRA